MDFSGATCVKRGDVLQALQKWVYIIGLVESDVKCVRDNLVSLPWYKRIFEKEYKYHKDWYNIYGKEIGFACANPFSSAYLQAMIDLDNLYQAGEGDLWVTPMQARMIKLFMGVEID